MNTDLTKRTVADAAPDVAVLSGTNIDNQITELFYLDRYITDKIELPHSYNDVSFEYDTFITQDNFNSKIDLLHRNFLYLNTQTKLAINDMPLDGVWEGAIGTETTVNGFKFLSPQTNTEAVTNVAASNGTVLSGFTDSSFVQDKDGTRFVGFVPVKNGTTLLALEVEHSSTAPYITAGRDPLDRFGGSGITTLETSTDLSFTNILDVEATKDGKLFVLDNNLIHKLNVESVLTHGTALTGVGRFLENSIGGETSSKVINSKCKNAKKIALDKNDNVYVLDPSLSGYKVFDKNLNWKENKIVASQFKALSGDTFIDINVHRSTGDVYLLSRDGVITIYNTSGNFLNTLTFSDRVSGETFKNIIFSEINNNIFYVLTEVNLYKKFVSRPSESIGTYKTSSILNMAAVSGTEAFSFFDVASGIGDRETLFLGSESTATYEPPVTNALVGKIFIEPYEKTNYKTLTYDHYKTQTYDLSSVYVEKDEYVSSFMVNKALYKILFNHMIFNDHIHSKVTGTYQANGQLELTDIEYLQEFETHILNLSANSNYFVGVNEPCIADVVNRCVKKIHNLQLEIAGTLQTTITNKYPLPEQTVELS